MILGPTPEQRKIFFKLVRKLGWDKKDKWGSPKWRSWLYQQTKHRSLECLAPVEIDRVIEQLTLLAEGGDYPVLGGDVLMELINEFVRQWEAKPPKPKWYGGPFAKREWDHEVKMALYECLDYFCRQGTMTASNLRGILRKIFDLAAEWSIQAVYDGCKAFLKALKRGKHKYYHLPYFEKCLISAVRAHKRAMDDFITLYRSVDIEEEIEKEIRRKVLRKLTGPIPPFKQDKPA